MKKEKFIEELISVSNFDWSDDDMKKISTHLGLDPNYYLVIFKDGVPEIMDYYDKTLDIKMLEALENYEKPNKIREKIASALRLRLRFDKAKHRLLRLKSVWKTSDAIWKYAGDTSVDFNYYSKRTLLSLVYIASFNYYKKDQSLNFVDTDVFIESSLEKIIKIFSIKSKLPKMEDIPILRLFS